MPKQILLADDSNTIRRVVEITFAREDVAITAVANGDEAFARAKELKPDLVLADAVMPGKSGYDLCAALRADPDLATTPCLILTGNFAPYDEARGQKAGADGFVVKPFETQALIDKSNDAIGKKGTPRPVAGAAASTTPAPKAPSPIPPLVPPPPPKPMGIEPLGKPLSMAETKPERSEDSLEISIEPAKSMPTPAPTLPPLVPAAKPPTPPTKPSIPAPPRPSSPPAAPAAATMMMEAPKLPVTTPTPPVVSSPAATPAAATMMMEAPRIPAAPPVPAVVAPPAPAPVAVSPPVAAKPAKPPTTIPANVPTMPRESLIPHMIAPMPAAAAIPPAPTPAASAPTMMAAASTPAPAVNKGTPPRTTILGMAAINPNNITAPTPPKPAWAPPGSKPADLPNALKPQPVGEPEAKPEPEPKMDLQPVVSAVAERAHQEIAFRSEDGGGAATPMSREAVEKIAWEVVPELAEAIIHEQLDRLMKERQK